MVVTWREFGTQLSRDKKTTCNALLFQEKQGLEVEALP